MPRFGCAFSTPFHWRRNYAQGEWLWLSVVAVAVLTFATPSNATTYNLTFGAPYAAGSFLTPSTAEMYSGAGSWYEEYPSAKTEIYVEPLVQFGTSFTVDQIASIKYRTVNDATNPSGVDFYMLIYTVPEYADNDATWYNKRLNSEPYLSNSYAAPVSGVWNTWTTDATTDQLTFFDANNCGNMGFYGAPTLADIQSGAINWSTWPSNPTQGGSDPVPIDYGAKTVKYLNWSTGGGWASFAGYIDAIEVNLTTGDTFVIDLESKTDPVYVDDSWAGTAPGVEVEPGKFFGWNAFATIADGIANVSGSSVYVAAGTYTLTSTLSLALPNMLLEGAGAGSSIIKVSGAVGYAFNVTGTGSTIRGFTVEKTDLVSPHNMSLINADDVTVEDNEFFGPDPGTAWSVNGLVSRALEIAGGRTGLVIQNNTVHTLRQPAYINPGCVGTVTGNHVYGTRGWVNDGSDISFTGNDWPCPGNQGADIALLASVNPLLYPDLHALSLANDDAYISGQFAGGKSGRALTYVDIAALAGGNGHTCHPYQSAGTGSINTLPGGTCYIAAGVYEEQVEVKENITVQGAGMGVTVIKSPVSLPLFFTTSASNYPVIYIHDVSNPSINDLTVDGAGRGNTNNRFSGVAFRNAGGVVDHVEVTDIRDTPFSGAQHGVAIYAFNDDGMAQSITVWDCDVHDFQKNAMALNAGATTPLAVDVQRNTVEGYGATTVTAQNGIQVNADMGTGMVSDNVVSGIAYDNTLDPTKYVATSILNFYADLDIIGNTVTQGHVGVYNIDGSSTISENDITIEKIGVYAFGIIATDPPKAVPSAIDGPAVFNVAKQGANRLAASAAALVSVDLIGNTVTFSGGDNTATYGIEADGGYGPDDLAIYAAENFVSGFEVGFELYACESACDVGVFTSAEVYSNSVEGSTFAIRSNIPWTVNASSNWWGSADPVTVDGLVEGDIDYSPWFGSGTDDDGGSPGFQGDFSVLWADDDSPQTGADHHIQEAIDLVSGSTVNLAPGTYTGQVVISGFADLNLIGAGAGMTVINPPATTMTYNYTTPSNNRAVIAVVNSDDVDISDLTVDGLGKGNINDRFLGIAFFESGGSVTDCEIKDVRHTPINGSQAGNAVYAYNFAAPDRTVDVTGCTASGFQKGGIIMNGDHLTANIVGNTVDGYGPASFIAMNGVQLGFGATGSVVGNQIDGCSYTPGTTVSCGVLLYNAAPITGTVQVNGNVIDECQVGAYYINVGGDCDSNTVTATLAGTGAPTFYGIILDPGQSERKIKPEPVEEAMVAHSSNHLAAGVAALTSSARWNTLDGGGAGYGIEVDAYSPEVLTASVEDNRITNFEVGLVLWEEAGATLDATVTSNLLLRSDVGLYNENGTVDAQFNVFANTSNADDNTAGNYYDQNCWSDYNGVGSYPVGGTGANVDNNPKVDCGLDMTPDDIAYLCSGEFTFDVTIGDAVSALDAAELHFTYPSELTVTAVDGALPNYLIFYTQTSLGAGQTDTLKVNLGVLVGVEDGPATLFTVKMSGSASCLDADIAMSFSDLRDSTNSTIVVLPAAPIHVVTDCIDPDIVVTSPASGGLYSVSSPLLDITATDDCAIEEAYYQVDGCTGAGWAPLGAGLPGAAFNLIGWAIPGYAGLADGMHCLYFKAVDDQGRMNSDTCTYTWCFTKDASPPPPPTGLVATPGHNKVHLSWTNATSDFDHTVIMRTDWYASGHEYPEYDDNSPEGPYPTDTTTGDRVYAGTGTAHIDTDDLSNATRDVYHFAAFTVDDAGNVSAPSNLARSTSYWLGDVTDNPMSVGSFDGYVYYQDLAILSNTFGLSHGQVGYENDFDIGPTYTGSPKGIPTTDNKVQFEDLAIFAINFDAVNPLMKVAPIFAHTSTDGPLAVRLVLEETATDELTVRVVLRNNPDAAKSIHFVVSSTNAGLKLIDARMSDALSASPMPVFFNGREVDGQVDVSLALLGGETAIGGSGELAVMRFKRVSAGAAILSFDEIDLRDGENNRLNAVAESAQLSGSSPLPMSYDLAQNYPNPFNAGTVITYRVPSTSDVSIVVYNVTGQVVRVLYQGQREQGQYDAQWDGTDNNGNHVSSGLYLYRINAGNYTASRKMMLIK